MLFQGCWVSRVLGGAQLSSWYWTASNRKQKSYLTVAWLCPGTTGQEKKCFGPISASGAPKRDKQEFSWCQTARIQSMILHTGSHGGGTLPLNCKEKRYLIWHKSRAANTFPETSERLGGFLLHVLLLKEHEQSKTCQTFLQNILTSCCIKPYSPNHTSKDTSLSIHWHAFTYCWETEAEILVAVVFLVFKIRITRDTYHIQCNVYDTNKAYVKMPCHTEQENLNPDTRPVDFHIVFRSSSSEGKMSSSKTCVFSMPC